MITNTDVLALNSLAKALGDKYRLSYDSQTTAACLWFNVSDTLTIPLAEIIYKKSTPHGGASWTSSGGSTYHGGSITITGGSATSGNGGHAVLIGGSYSTPASNCHLPFYKGLSLPDIELSSCIKEHMLGCVVNSDFILREETSNNILINGCDFTRTLDVRDPEFTEKALDTLENVFEYYNLKKIRSRKSTLYASHLCCR